MVIQVSPEDNIRADEGVGVALVNRNTRNKHNSLTLESKGNNLTQGFQEVHRIVKWDHSINRHLTNFVIRFNQHSGTFGAHHGYSNPRYQSLKSK